MSKFIVLMVFVAGLCGPAGAASSVHTPSDTTGTTYAHDATNNLPYQVNELRSEVKALQGQVSALQNTNMEQNDASAAQLWPVGTGG
jgi:TolA-binding protein